MKTQIAMAALALLGLSACATSPTTRIENDPATYARSSKQEQAKIRSGEVAVGFSREQVRMSLGDPSSVTTRTTDRGVSEVWSYHETGPRFGFGVGVGGGGGGVGVGVGSGAQRTDEPKMRIVFEADRVASVERKAKS